MADTALKNNDAAILRAIMEYHKLTKILNYQAPPALRISNIRVSWLVNDIIGYGEPSTDGDSPSDVNSSVGAVEFLSFE